MLQLVKYRPSLCPADMMPLAQVKNLIMLKDDKGNAKAVLASLQILHDPLVIILAHTEDPVVQQELLFKKFQMDKLNETVDFERVIEAQGVVDKILSSHKGVLREDDQAALNTALDFVSSFERKLKTAPMFDLNALVDMTLDKSAFFTWLSRDGNHSRTLKELAAKSKEACEAIALRLSPTLQTMLQDHLNDGGATVVKLLSFIKEGLELSRGTYDIRLLAMTHAEFDASRPYAAYLSLLSTWTDCQRARVADKIQKLPNVVLWNLFTAQHFKATNDMITRGLLVKMPLKDGLPDSIELEATLDSAGRLLRIQGDPGPPAAALASSYAQKVPSYAHRASRNGVKEKLPFKIAEKPIAPPERDFQSGHCRNFAVHGACRFGQKCKFKHVAYAEDKHVRVVPFGSKSASAATPGKATSAAAAVEEDDDDGRQEFFGAPEVYHS